MVYAMGEGLMMVALVVFLVGAMDGEDRRWSWSVWYVMVLLLYEWLLGLEMVVVAMAVLMVEAVGALVLWLCLVGEVMRVQVWV